jgi:endonuclease YncB( thermonuclease family)
LILATVRLANCCTAPAGGANSKTADGSLKEHGRDLKIGENRTDAQACKGFEKAVADFMAPAGLAILFTFLSLAPGPFAKETGASDACAVKGGSHAAVSAVSERLELTLADGRVLRIAGVEAAGPTPSDPELGTRGRDWLTGWLENRDISYQALDARPDRWGRIAAVIFAAPVPGDASPPSAGESLVRQGFARVAPDQHKSPCEKRLLEAERAARAAGLGLWSDRYYNVIAATDALAFTEHAGSLVLAEGRVSEVRDGSGRTTLFFGPHRRDHLAVTVLQRNVKIFEAAGLHFHDLIGQTLRVRGLLETRFGPEIEVTAPSEVELIADGPGEAAKPVQNAPAMTQP